MVSLNTLQRGLSKGLNTTWVLAKVVIPVYLIMALLGQTPILGWLAKLAQPLMSLLGLPGEAATALVIGNGLNIYAALGAIGSLQLDSKEITIIALVLLISHSLPVETAVSKKTGINVTSLVLIRIFGGLLSGMFLNWAWQGWWS